MRCSAASKIGAADSGIRAAESNNGSVLIACCQQPPKLSGNHTAPLHTAEALRRHPQQSC
eukprot:220274-Amphidinium_carterae.1